MRPINESVLLVLLPLLCGPCSYVLSFAPPQKSQGRLQHLYQSDRNTLVATEETSTSTTTVISPGTTTTTTTTKEERAAKAQQTWSTIALQPTPRQDVRRVSLLKDATVADSSNSRAVWEEFCTTIKGTYLINGLASCQMGDRILHPFEAHGLCKSLVFDGQGNLVFKSKLVGTQLNTQEVNAGKILARGVMSTQHSFDNPLGAIRNALSPTERDTANLVANLWPLPNTDSSFEPMVITCTDNGEPHVLDPQTLTTRGKLVDVVPKLKPVLEGKGKFLAHTRMDESRQRFIMCLNDMDIPGDEAFQGNSTYTFLEFDSNFDLITSRSVTTRFMVAHDWVITENYYIVPKNPARLVWPKLMQFLLGVTVGTDIFEMEHETNGEFILVPRHDETEPIHHIESDAFFNLFHFGPCYEEAESADNNNSESSSLVIHGCVFDSYQFGGEMGFDGPSQRFDPVGWATSRIEDDGDNNNNDERRLCAPAPRLDKFVIDLDTLQLQERTRFPVIDPKTGEDIPVDMPTFVEDAKKCRYSYFLGACRPEGWFPFRSIVKLDLQSGKILNWDAGDGQVCSEPMFVPRPTPQAEDDGYVLSIVHNSEDLTCRLVVWDSQTFANGPIAKVPLGDLVPWCVHGSWIPEYNP